MNPQTALGGCKVNQMQELESLLPSEVFFSSHGWGMQATILQGGKHLGGFEKEIE